MTQIEHTTVWSLSDINTLVEGVLEGEGATQILGLSSVEDAREGDLLFAESTRFLNAALRSPASAIITTPAIRAEMGEVSKPLILAENARLAFMTALERFAPPLHFPEGIHPSAIIASDVVLGEGVRIGPGVTVEEGCRIGDRAVLFPGVYVGYHSSVGDDSVLYPHVALYPRVTVGKRCILHANSVIGADGFGFVLIGSVLRKVPHLGSVELGDDVEIGACSTVDRSKTGITRIGSGTKLDNHVQVAHNCTIGRFCVISAHTGIAGGAIIGDGVIFAGQSGAADHVTIGDRARLVARAGAIGNVPAGETYSGFPARPHRRVLKEWAAVGQLPEGLRRLKALEKRIAELEERLMQEEPSA